MHVGRTLESAAREDAELASKGILKGCEPAYQGRGIGTALAQVSVRWAREHDFMAVIAVGAPGGLFTFARWSGQLPWTSYARLGFETVAMEPLESDLPVWAQGAAPPEVLFEVKSALANGRPPADFRSRLMVLNLGDSS
jgi:GNAT superfamily N-acetyltransferase